MKKKLLMLCSLAVLSSVAYGDDQSETNEYQIKAMEVPVVNQWNISTRTYIENELYYGETNKAMEEENILIFGTGINASKGKLTLGLNVEQRLTGHLNTEGADNQNTRVDYKVRYQAFDKVGLALKYRSERGSQKRDGYSAEFGRNRDRVEIGIDTAYRYFSGWGVVGHDVDSKLGAKGKGNYYEFDFGPTFKLSDTFALRPTFYSTGEWYEGYGDDSTKLFDHQIRLMGIYNITDNFTLMPRVRYSLSRENDYRGGNRNDMNIYKSNYRVRAELLAGYTINEKISLDAGLAYDWQERDYSSRKDDMTIDMIWYTVGMTYKF